MCAPTACHRVKIGDFALDESYNELTHFPPDRSTSSVRSVARYPTAASSLGGTRSLMVDLHCATRATSAWSLIWDGNGPMPLSWSLEADAQPRDIDMFNASDIVFQIMVGSDEDGHSTFSSSSDFGFPSSAPDLNVVDGYFKLRLWAHLVNGPLRKVLAVLSHGALDNPKLVSEGKECDYFLSGYLREQVIVGDLGLEVRWFSCGVLGNHTFLFEPL